MARRLHLWVCCLPLLLAGCMQMALRASPSLFPNFTTSIFEECDTQLASSAIPANLKLLEGLLKNDPGNRQILSSLSMGFGGYSMLFVEEKDPERASRLYLRARDYGLRALGGKGARLKDALKGRGDLEEILESLGKEDLEPLLWATVSWNAWIQLNLDRPTALAQLRAAQACLERVMEIGPTYFQGLPYILMGASLAARPPMLGGDPRRAREHFEKALLVSQGKFFLAQYYFARYYAVRTQDKALFLRLTNAIVEGDPREMEGLCLINRVMQQRAKRLQDMVEEFFF